MEICPPTLSGKHDGPPSLPSPSSKVGVLIESRAQRGLRRSEGDVRCCFLVPFFFSNVGNGERVGRGAWFELQHPRGFDYLTLRLSFSLPMLTCAFSCVDGDTYATSVLLCHGVSKGAEHKPLEMRKFIPRDLLYDGRRQPRRAISTSFYAISLWILRRTLSNEGRPVPNI
jgi:hypothetical protein